jgi:hypothetical protein
MANPSGVKIMTSDDIFFEVNGQKVAGVESYSTKYTNDVKMVDAFGQNTSIGYTLGSRKYNIDISRVYLEDTAIADGIDFYSLTNFGFNFVVVKNGVRTVFKDCIISDISEDGSLKKEVAEKISLLALDRVVE